MSATATPGTDRSSRRTPALSRDVTMRLAAHEYEMFVAQLGKLSPEDWSRPTVCPAWDVHAMACHVLGAAEMASSVPEQVRQMTAARRAGGLLVDALTAVQVAKHIARTPADVAARMAAVAPRAATGRRRTPSLLRRISIGDQPVDETGAQTEKWTLGYLTDVIFTRDTWMHRSDIATAVGRSMSLTAEHDGVLVADIAAEWAGRHGQPCTLILTGTAGGSWTFGGGALADPPQLELDAVEFCRILSGRGSGEGLLTTRVPF